MKRSLTAKQQNRLAEIADLLDSKGLVEEADEVDSILDRCKFRKNKDKSYDTLSKGFEQPIDYDSIQRLTFN